MNPSMRCRPALNWPDQVACFLVSSVARIFFARRLIDFKLYGDAL